MTSPFKKLALAFTFSPSREMLLNQTAHLVEMFRCEILIYHVGSRTEEKEAQIRKLCGFQSYGKLPEIRWLSGDPAKAIMKQGAEDKIDLLVMGALEKETTLKYLIGSVARDILRQSRFSVICFIDPGVRKFEKIVTAIDYTSFYEFSARTTQYIAEIDGTRETIFVKDVYIPALSSITIDSGSSDEVEETRAAYLTDEESKLSLFLKETGVKDFSYNVKALYGREAVHTHQFTIDVEADLLIYTVRNKKLSIFDRIFTHDAEFIFEELPANLLLIKRD